MDLKFLPLGSVCLIDNSDLKLVVIGYKAKEHDYIAVEYPIGYSIPENLRYFNHEQIKELYSYGYKDEVGKSHFISLNDGTPSAANIEVSDSKFKFDDMGIVVADETVSNIAEQPLLSNFKFDENGIVVEDLTAPAAQTTQSNFKFDENGIVVEDLTAPAAQTTTNNFKFDENGVVVEDLTAPAAQTTSSNFKFDENGIVVEDLTAPAAQTTSSNFKFDENGIVVEDLTAPAVQTTQSNFKFDENGIVVEDLTASIVPSINNFQFDENGVVIADMTATITDDIQTSQEEKTNMPVADSSDLNDEWTISLDSDLHSIFDNIETPGIVEESKEEVVFEEKVEEETSNLDIPSSEVATVPEESAAVATFETAEQSVGEKKEEKKKRGFFSFGK